MRAIIASLTLPLLAKPVLCVLCCANRRPRRGSMFYLPARPELKKVLDPFRFLLIAVAGWMNQAQQQMIDSSSDTNARFRARRSGLDSRSLI